MKKNIHLIIVFIALLIFVACDSRLDLEPVQEVKEEVIITNSEGIINLLNGAYSGIKGTFGTNEGGEIYGGHFNFFSEELANDGDADFIGTFQTHRDLFDKQLIASHTMVRDSWIRAYDVINSLNIVLDKLDIVDEADRERVEGEALCIRGMMYFELGRFWGEQWIPGGTNQQLSVPIRLEPTYTIEDAIFIPRSSAFDVYQQAISDLTRAETLLNDYGKNSFRVSTYTASAFLARIYLQQSQFEQAAIKADRVIASGEFELVAEPIDAFNKDANTTEDVFAIQQSTNSNAGSSNDGLTTHYASLEGHGRGDIIITAQHLARYEDGDLRGQLTDDLSSTAKASDVKTMFYIGIDQNSGFTHIVKWGDWSKNIPVVRLAEMYLTRAEGNFEAGTNHGATPLSDINTIRNRAALADLTAVDRDAIRNERSLELAYEGFALHDIKRWNLSVGSLPYSSPALVLPIPEREIDVNPEMVQNTGY